MKKILVALMLSGVCSCHASTPTGKVAVKVVDEDGTRIGGAHVKVYFESELNKDTVRQGVSNTNDLFTASAPAINPYATVVVTKNGYYKSAWGYMFTGRNALLNRYTPWGDVRTLTLRKVAEPVAGKIVSTKQKPLWKTVPRFDAPVGFDLLKSDWVSPYGKGVKADFILAAKKQEDGKVSEYTIRFKKEGDGIQKYQIPKEITSAFKWPYKAPLTGYDSELKKVIGYRGVTVREEERIRNPEEIGYIFRIRTVYDKDGEIVSAFYGKIWGEILVHPKGMFQLGGWLNTDSHSRSLESMHPTSP